MVKADDVTRTSDLSGFTEVELDTSIDLKIIIDDDYSITIEGDEDRIGNLDLDQSGDELRISSSRRFGGFFGRKSLGSMSLEITMPDLEELTINGSGDVEIIGLDNDEISLNINSSGDLYVTGKSERIEIEIHGSGDVEMDDITSKNVEIELQGSGNVDFDGGTCDSLEIEVDGSGDVDAKDFVCETAEVDIEGSGNSRVYVTESIIFDGDGSGRLDVFGNPKKVVDNAARRKSKIRIR